MEKKIIGVAIAVASFIVGERYNRYFTAKGLEKFHDAGIIKFFDGDKEVDVKKAIELAKNLK